MSIWVEAISIAGLLGALFYTFWQKRIFGKRVLEAEAKVQTKIEKREAEISRRMYELAILKELGDRIGYSLNVQNIVEVITGSLHQFIDYSAVSYMLLGGDRIIFKIHLEKSVSRSFIDEVRNRMLKSLSALLDKEFTRNEVEEVLSGAILLEDIDSSVQSFFNIPLVIRDKVVGVLTVAHTAAGLYKEEEMTILYKITQQASKAVARLEEVVEIEERKLNAMVESISEGVVMTDKDYRVLVVNPAARRILNLESQKEITIFDLIHHLEGKLDIRGKLEESIRFDKVLETPEVMLGERFFQIFVAPVKSTKLGEMETLGGVVIFHDITHDKELAKLRDDFSAMMVHELRSPLVGIKGFIESMNEDMRNIPKDLAENLGLIRESSSQMLELVNDLLDVAKLEAGKFEIHSAPVDIRKLIQDRVMFFSAVAAESKLTLESVFGKDIPDKINCDSKLISQALNNLISNAIKFTPAGGKVTIQAFIHRKGQNIIEEARQNQIFWLLEKDERDVSAREDSLIIGVTDTGIGISPQDVGNLFSKFKQFGFGAVRSEKRGTGLGLVIVKGIIETHNGLVGVASKENSGSTFYFTLPLSL